MDLDVLFRFLVVTSSIFLTHLAQLACSEGYCRKLTIAKILEKQALANHTIYTIQPIKDDRTCRSRCFLEPRCLSVNFCTKPDGTATCELANSTHTEYKASMVEKPGCTYYGSQPCGVHPCLNKGICDDDSEGDDPPYRCICSGTTGKHCENDINECAKNTHDCNSIHVNATCLNTIGGYECSCIKTNSDDITCYNHHNCTELAPLMHKDNIGKSLLVGQGETSRYCDFSEHVGCGPGPWTLTMKINGSMKTFTYDSHLWTNKSTYNPDAMFTGFDDQETKSTAYWDTPLTKLCLGMRYGGVTRWIPMGVQASSLHALMSNDSEVTTDAADEQKWRSLLPPDAVSLHTVCKKEGFNLIGRSSGSRKLRLGLFTDNSNNCGSHLAFIGLGYENNPNVPTCGAYAPSFDVDNGQKTSPAMCYVLIQ